MIALVSAPRSFLARNIVAILTRVDGAPVRQQGLELRPSKKMREAYIAEMKLAPTIGVERHGARVLGTLMILLLQEY